MAKVTNGKLNRKVDRGERQCEQDPPASSSRDEAKRTSGLKQVVSTHQSVQKTGGILTIKHFPATAALPCAKFQNVPVRRENVIVRPHSTIAKQTLVLRQQIANIKERKAMARR